MKIVTIYFGNITFDGATCTVHEVKDTLTLPVSVAEIIAEEVVNAYDGYIIPDVYHGTVTWENGKGKCDDYKNALDAIIFEAQKSDSAEPIDPDGLGQSLDFIEKVAITALDKHK